MRQIYRKDDLYKQFLIWKTKYWCWAIFTETITSKDKPAENDIPISFPLWPSLGHEVSFPSLLQILLFSEKYWGIHKIWLYLAQAFSLSQNIQMHHVNKKKRIKRLKIKTINTCYFEWINKVIFLSKSKRQTLRLTLIKIKLLFCW